MSDVLNIKVELADTEPVIWRRLLVDETTSFMDLHHIIQIAMGWKNYHLFEFNLDGYKVGKIYHHLKDEGTDGLLDAADIKLSDILSLESDEFTYEYDFGDGWQHKVLVEEKIKKLDEIVYPTCTEGELGCPPEDCGGIGGFYNLLAVMADKKHPDYKQTKMWLGRGYNAENFDLVKVNKQLSQLKRYIKKWNSLN